MFQISALFLLQVSKNDDGERCTPPRTARIPKRTKILSHETTIFGLKMMVKSGLNFLF